MRRWLLLLVLCLHLCLLNAAASGEARTHVYGGSEDDALYDMAISGDGRVVMTGYTNSADGTLSGRTKVGRSGWALCVDMEGNVLWSFVSRLGVHDSMAKPVFHADGSVTVVLEAEPDDGMELEAIRLNREGKVVSRKTMCKAGEKARYVMLVNAYTQEGYAVFWANEQAETVLYALYDYDGQLIGEYTPEEWQANGGAMIASEQHVVRIGEEAGTLYSVDEQGNETALCDVFDLYPQENVNGSLLGGRYDGLISLSDGGAAGCGWVLNGTQNGDPRPGRITRWDAQGNPVFDMWMEIGQLSELVKTDDGFAAILYPEEDGPRTAPIPYSLVYFDENGIYRGRTALETGEDCMMRRAQDGTLVILQRFYEDGQGDARLTVIDAR